MGDGNLDLRITPYFKHKTILKSFHKMLYTCVCSLDFMSRKCLRQTSGPYIEEKLPRLRSFPMAYDMPIIIGLMPIYMGIYCRGLPSVIIL